MSLRKKYTKEFLEEIVKESDSFKEVVLKANGNYSGGSHKMISEYIKEYNIDTSHFYTKTQFRYTGKNKLSPEEVFLQTKSVRYKLKRALEESGVSYTCSECKQPPEHNGKVLTLQVDHIDGNKKNNFKDNLRFLCPNCHSQTETWGYKNNSTENRIYLIKNSNVNFKKYGWAKQIALLINVSTSSIVINWMKKYMLEFYEKECYKR